MTQRADAVAGSWRVTPSVEDARAPDKGRAAPPPPPAGRDSFASVIARALDRPSGAAARQAAEQLVSTAFIAPVLAALRAGSIDDGPFAPGFAESQFLPLLHGHIADRVVKAARLPLVDALLKRLSGADPAPVAASGAPPVAGEAADAR
jgi:hypothetical protein